jgi:uncharacterized protein (UPF0276 family)
MVSAMNVITRIAERIIDDGMARPPLSPCRMPAGIGLRQRHHAEMLTKRPEVGFMEVHAENFMCGGAQIRLLEKARNDWPISIHGVGLGLGGAHELDANHLERLATLVERITPVLVSEHVAWCGGPGLFMNDLLPPPYTEEALASLVRHIDQVQARLKRRILIENPSTYFEYVFSDIPEGEFLAQAALRSGCGLLLDVNNLYVNQRNHGAEPIAIMNALPTEAVQEIHVAGHHVVELGDATLLIDNHGGPVSDAVWRLYDGAVARFSKAATLIEWDSNVPTLDILVGQAHLADTRGRAAIEAPHGSTG